jgi:hypothetical protein
MDLSALKYRICPYDQTLACLIVDVETESVPYADADGTLLYYCQGGGHTIALAGEEEAPPPATGTGSRPLDVISRRTRPLVRSPG